MGNKLNAGRGGLAPEDPTDHGFQTNRAKVPVGRGASIGSFPVDGEQAKGDVGEDLAEMIEAREREASERVNRGTVPRHYHQAVKGYFSHGFKDAVSATGGPVEGEPDAPPDGGEKPSLSPGASEQ